MFGNDPYAAGLHRGVDIGAAPGTSVRAPRAGLVRFAGTVPGNGRTLTIETADGYSVTLLHLGSFSVARGATVAEGDAVAVVGPSGGIEHELPSVHLGVRVTADPQGYIDPLPLLPVAAPIVPEASEPEPPADPEPSAPETPSEAPDASEPELPAADEPAGEPPLPVQVPAASVPDLAHAPAVELAPEAPSAEPFVPAAPETPVQQPRSAPGTEAAPPARGATTADASTIAPREEVVRSDRATSSSLSHWTHDASIPIASPADARASAARTGRDRQPWQLPTVVLVTALLAVLLGVHRRLVRRRVHPPVRSSSTTPDWSSEAQLAAEAAEPRELAEFEPQAESFGRPPCRPSLRPDPDRGGPRLHRGRVAGRRRSARQPVPVAGARRRR
jgi:hypothetical protein